LIPDPEQIIHDLGMDSAAIIHINTLSIEHGHAMWQVMTASRSYILKWLPRTNVEIESYLLMKEIGVPTLQLFGSTAQALLLEDLTNSEKWRLATPDDMSRADVGRAVARWYRIFHHAGAALLSQSKFPDFLTRETDELHPDSIRATGRLANLPDDPIWDFAAEHIELLKAATSKLSVTLNYNDFYWTNLALQRHAGDQPEAIIFDYHLLGVGMRYSDCRNVTGSLFGEAVDSFWDTYGDVDPREEILDRPLADLLDLVMAANMARFPKWAEPSRERLTNGELKRDLMRAVELARILLAAS
jgi:hypothetical protein